MKRFMIGIGILVVVLFIVILSIYISEIFFNRQVAAEVKELLENNQLIGEVVQESEIETLPDPLKRYLRKINIVGKNKIRFARITQKGFMRTKPEQKWMLFTAEQYVSISPPSFIWNVTVKPMFPIRLKGRDKYYQGKGNMFIKLLPIFKIANETGNEIDQGTLVRYFSEMIWYPTALLSEYINWEQINDSSVLGTITYGGVTASAVLSFSENGDFKSFTADRYMSANGKSRKEKWSVYGGTYKEFDGVKVPVKGGAQWNLSSGDFNWIKLEITGIEFGY